MTDNLVRTPLYDEHLALGARMVDFAGFDMPVQYSGIIEEHLATRSSVGIFDVSHMAEFRVAGPGCYQFLQGMLTNDISLINETGKAQYTLMLNDDGHIIDDLIVYNTGFEYLIIANASNREKDWNWLWSHKPDDVDMVDETERTGLIAVQGPEAKRIMQELCGQDWVAPERFTLVPATIDGRISCLVARTGYTGEDGFELIVHAEDLVTVWRVLLSFNEVSPVGLGARDTLRLEMGYHLYGNDMDETRDPISAGLGWVCPKAKAEDYTGRAVVENMRAIGPRERLVHLLLEGKGVPRHGMDVLKDGEVVGIVGSGSHSPSLQKGIATAYVPADYAEPGTKLDIQIRKNVVPAVVVKPPFYKH